MNHVTTHPLPSRYTTYYIQNWWGRMDSFSPLASLVLRSPAGLAGVRSAYFSSTGGARLGFESYFRIPKQQNRFSFFSSDEQLATVFWWGRMDSNHRRQRQRVYSPPHLAALAPPRLLCLSSKNTYKIKY